MAIDIWLSPWKVTASCTHPAAELRTSLHDSSATLPWCNCCECIVCWATTALPWCLSSDGSDGGDGGGLKGPSHAFYDGWCWCWFKYDFWRPGGNEAKTRWNVWLIYLWLGVQCTMRGELWKGHGITWLNLAAEVGLTRPEKAEISSPKDVDQVEFNSKKWTPQHGWGINQPDGVYEQQDNVETKKWRTTWRMGGLGIIQASSCARTTAT